MPDFDGGRIEILNDAPRPFDLDDFSQPVLFNIIYPAKRNSPRTGRYYGNGFRFGAWEMQQCEQRPILFVPTKFHLAFFTMRIEPFESPSSHACSWPVLIFGEVCMFDARIAGLEPSASSHHQAGG
jgi:hypothetical protein